MPKAHSSLKANSPIKLSRSEMKTLPEKAPLEKLAQEDLSAAPSTDKAGIKLGTSYMASTPIASAPRSDKVSGVIPGRTSSGVFQRNAKKNNMAPEQWQGHLNETEDKMLERDADNKLAMSDDEFNKTIGDAVVQNMEEQRALHQQGMLMELPAKGKAIVIGDLHEQNDNLVAILQHIQANPETNLDKNPDVQLIFLGDLFGGTKSPNEIQPPLQGDNVADKANGEITNRLLTLLAAKYPEQVRFVAGNHDIGIVRAHELLGGKNMETEPTAADKDAIKNNPDLSDEEKKSILQDMDDYTETKIKLVTDAKGTHGGLTRSITNNEHAVNKIKNSAMAIVMGDKSKGEKVRLFVHSPPGHDVPDLSALARTPDMTKAALELSNRLHQFYAGHGGLQQQDMEPLLKRLGVDEIYFGHTDPAGFLERDTQMVTDPTTGQTVPKRIPRKDANGNPVLASRIEKNDQVPSPIGQLKGGGNFIDSQGKGKMSGYMVVDVDNDTTQTHLMEDVLNNPDDPVVRRVVDAGQNTESTVDPKQAKMAGMGFMMHML